jgi:NADH-quinone oxidoreductase subunit J
MLLNLRKDEFGSDEIPGVKFLGGLLAIVLLVEFLAVFSSGGADVSPMPEGFGGIRTIGRLLFSKYLLPFELTGLLLLAAGLAVIVIAREKSPRQTEDM